MEKVRAHVFFSGRVQGVFFRAFTKENADRLGINGWVRNLPDGRVEAVFQGDSRIIQKMLRVMKEKHPFAIVKSIRIEDFPDDVEFEDFSIVRE